MTGKHEGTGLRNTLRERRNARGWSQEDLAHAVGVSRKTINTVERGRFVPSTVLALKLAAVFHCAVEELFSLEVE
ncbi:MAG: helix-turn-helix transcriptional regulator [Pseudomonadota bacterium]